MWLYARMSNLSEQLFQLSDGVQISNIEISFWTWRNRHLIILILAHLIQSRLIPLVTPWSLNKRKTTQWRLPPTLVPNSNSIPIGGTGTGLCIIVMMSIYFLSIHLHVLCLWSVWRRRTRR